MANGDITSVKILGSFNIGGGGATAAGGAANNKVLTWGQIVGTWEDTHGLNLVNVGGFGALGLSSCDFIRFDVVSSGASGSPVYSAEAATWTAGIGRDDENIYVVTDGDTNPVTEGHIVVLNFLACGDSNEVADLT
jgi:hypothetical protein